MELVNIFEGEELVYEKTMAFRFVTTIPDDIIDKAIEWHEGKEAEIETDLLKDWYDTAYNEDHALEMCKELWRIRFRLEYLRYKFYGFPPSEDEGEDEKEDETMEDDDDDTNAAKMTEEEMDMEELVQSMGGTTLKENWRGRQPSIQ